MQTEVLPLASNWSQLKKVAFRFVFIYFLVYCFPFPFDNFKFTDAVVQPYFNLLDYSIQKIGYHLFHVPVHVAFPTFDKFDDSYYGLTFLLTNLVLSAIGTLVWSLLDRQRTHYTRLYNWLWLYLRYFLASFLLGYGFVKFFPSQFQAVTASRLVMEVGEQSPMLLAWNFMGYSVVFNKISGSLEIVAAVLLFFRRTTTLGALLATITFSFVALLDYCFNVPVRFLVSHLLLISLLLLLNDGKRLWYVLILNKQVEAANHPPLFNTKKWQRVLLSFLVLLAVCMLYKAVADGKDAARQWGREAPPVPLYGVYKTTAFIRNHDTMPPLETDSLRWKQLVIDGGSWKQSGLIEFNSDQKVFYNIKADTLKCLLYIQSLADTTIAYTFHFEKPAVDRLRLDGLWVKDSITVLLTKYDLNHFNLNNDRFRIVEQ
jgi:hypothetical protein